MVPSNSTRGHLPRRKRRGLPVVGPHQRGNFLPVFSRSNLATHPCRVSQGSSRTYRGHRSRFRGQGDCLPVPAKNSRVVPPRPVATATAFGSSALPGFSVVAQPTKSALVTVLPPSCDGHRYGAWGPKPADSGGCVVGFTRFPPVPRTLRVLVYERDASRLVNAVNGGIPSLFKDGSTAGDDPATTLT